MGLFDKLKNELIDIIEWTDDSANTMVWRFPRHQNEIKYGAQLTVRESQQAVFVNEGKIAMICAYICTYTVPNFTDQKWGTKNPIMLRDARIWTREAQGFRNICFESNRWRKIY
jgi:membrane protease subunit (stomatin/prohibitin family)